MTVSAASRRAVIGVGALAGALFCAGTAAAIDVGSSVRPAAQNLVVGGQTVDAASALPVPPSSPVRSPPSRP